MHTDHLQDVPRLLRVVERPQVVEIVRAAVSVQRGQHRESGVGGCQSLRVVRGGRDLERALRVRPAFLPASAKPVRRSTPREHERDVAGLALLVPAIVGRERLVEAPAKVVEQADPPGECGRDDVGVPGRALEAPKRILPVAAKPERLAGKHLVLRRTAARAEQCDRLEHRIDRPAREDPRSGIGKHAGDLVEVADRHEAAQRLLGLVVVVEPARCLGAHGLGRLVARRVSARERTP